MTDRSYPNLGPGVYLRRMAERHPGCWRAIERMRAERGRGLPDWASWCFLPLAGSYAILSGGGPNRLRAEQAGEIAAFAALAAWRVTQGIYRIHPAVRAALESTPIDGSIPVDVLHRLPEWCVYVETPGLRLITGEAAGFFAYIESDANTAREELRFVLDCPPLLIGQVPIHLDRGGVELGIAAAKEEAERNLALADHSLADALHGAPTTSALARDLSPLVNLVLYLCAENSELRDASGQRERPELPRATKTKTGPRLFPPDHPTAWEVGMRLGAALESVAAEPSDPADGTHASPRPHIRRAHWHHFWAGPPDHKELILRWLAPMAVNVDLQRSIVPTVRPVGE